MIATEDQAREWLLQTLAVDSGAMARLERLVVLLRDENARQNLVSAASLTDVWRRHIADSAQLLRHEAEAGLGPWLDLGSGAGFPGLVIAALRPERAVVLVESRAMRIAWLERACTELGLARVRVAGCRLERVEDFCASVISARAFAPLDRLLALSARFSTADTLWLLPKGRSAQQERDSLIGWNHLFHVEQSLTDADAGVIVGRLLGRKGRKRS